MLPSPWRPWGNAVSLQSGTHTGGERMEDTGGCSRDSYESSDTQTQERRGRGGGGCCYRPATRVMAWGSWEPRSGWPWGAGALEEGRPRAEGRNLSGKKGLTP